MISDTGFTGALQATIDRGDWFAVEALLADCATLHVPGRSGLSGPYRGRDAIHALLEKLEGLADGTFGFEPERVVADGDMAMVLGRFVCRHRGAVRLTPAVLACAIGNGRVIEIRVFPDGRPGLHILDG